MKYSALLSLLSVALAQPLAHQHHIHKRQAVPVPEAQAAADVVTVFVTQTVDAQSQPTSSASAPSTTTLENLFTLVSSDEVDASSSALAETLNTDSALYPETSSNTTVSSGTSYAASSSAVSGSSSTTSSSVSTGTGAVGAAEGAKGITYSPYTDQGTCKSQSTIESDIKLLSDFSTIRLYDTDCSAVEYVLAAKTSSQKLFAGIYYLDKIDASVDIIADAISSTSSSWSDLYTVSVGNELVNSGEATTSQIQQAIESTRSALKAKGYTGTVVSVDTLVAVENNPALCEYSDFIAVNSHPYWDGHVAPENSGEWLKTQIASVKATCGGEKDVLITETGWPTKGDTYITAVPSPANQLSAIKSLVSAVGDQILLFTMYNDMWKQPGPYASEQYWGIFN